MENTFVPQEHHVCGREGLTATRFWRSFPFGEPPSNGVVWDANNCVATSGKEKGHLDDVWSDRSLHQFG